jgi:POLQ-like helicase
VEQEQASGVYYLMSIECLTFPEVGQYGLPDAKCIALYELGFADRMVSIDLSETLGDVAIDKRSLIRAIKSSEPRIREVLNNYPLFFTERLDSFL